MMLTEDKDRVIELCKNNGIEIKFDEENNESEIITVEKDIKEDTDFDLLSESMKEAYKKLKLLFPEKEILIRENNS